MLCSPCAVWGLSVLSYILGVCEWTFGRDWDCSRFAKKKRMPKLPAERGGERRKGETKGSSETKMNGKNEWMIEPWLFTYVIYTVNCSIVVIHSSTKDKCSHVANWPQVKLTCTKVETHRGWRELLSLSICLHKYKFCVCVSLLQLYRGERLNKVQQTNNNAAATPTGWRSCSVSAYLHLLCRISSNLYSRHRQADRHQPAK